MRVGSYLNSDIVMMNVILGHFDLKMIGSQIDAFADCAEVGSRRAFELRQQTGPRSPRPSWNGVPIRSQNRGKLPGGSGRAAKGASRHISPGYSATNGSRGDHVPRWTRWSSRRAITRWSADSVGKVQIWRKFVEEINIHITYA